LSRPTFCAYPMKEDRHQSEQLRLCFENAPVGIGFLNLDLQFLQANPFLERILTGSSQAIEGGWLSEILERQLSPESSREILRICSNTIQTGKPHALHGWPASIDAKGLPRFADWEIRRIETTAQGPAGLLVTVSDVTRQKYVEEKVRLLASVLETTPDWVAVLSPEGNVLYLNRSAKEAAGLTDAAPIHTLHYSDLHPEWATQLLRKEGFPVALKEGIWEGETAFRSARGGDIPVSQVLCSHANPAGEVEFLSSILRDITEAHQFQAQLASAQESLEQRVEERTAALAEASALIRDRVHQQAAVAELGEQALSGTEIPKLLNESTRSIVEILRVDFCSLRELSETGEFLELRACTGFPQLLAQPILPAGSGSPSGFALQTGEPIIFEDLRSETRFTVNQWLRDSGCASGVAVPISIGEKPFGSLSVFTTTHRSFTENDTHFLQSVANIIAAAVQRQRTEAGIQRALEQAEMANRAKSAFLSRMSHELRTPLNAILGFTQLLKLEEPTASQLESLGHVNRAGHHLLSLINEVLDISHIEAGRLALTIQPIELNDFLHNCIELMRPLALRNSVRLQFIPRTKPTHVSADKQRLKQVVLNFLSNAIKYNNEGGEVLISLRTCIDTARFEVRDTGPGIPSQMRGLLFKPFERLGAEHSEVEGAGIGLALCKGFVEAMGGSIGLDNPDSGGCVFWAQLPMAACPADEPQLRIGGIPELLALPRKPDASARLLYVESHDFDLQLLERLLQKHPNYSLLSAMQGSMGLDLAREHRPDLILVDLDLPDLTAQDFLLRLRSEAALSSVPLILLATNNGDSSLEVLAHQHGASFLLKPYAPEEMLQRIHSCLRQSAPS
jgi:PAS domain S-box-containing protein